MAEAADLQKDLISGDKAAVERAVTTIANSPSNVDQIDLSEAERILLGRIVQEGNFEDGKNAAAGLGAIAAAIYSGGEATLSHWSTGGSFDRGTILCAIRDAAVNQIEASQCLVPFIKDSRLIFKSLIDHRLYSEVFLRRAAFRACAWMKNPTAVDMSLQLVEHEWADLIDPFLPDIIENLAITGGPAEAERLQLILEKLLGQNRRKAGGPFGLAGC